MSAYSELIKAAEVLRERFITWKETQEENQGNAWTELSTEEIWEPEDQAALDAYDAAKQRLLEELA